MPIATTVPATPRIDGRGFAAAMGAFLVWGLLPLYLKQMQSVPAMQIVAHRLMWGCLFAIAWLALRNQLGRVKAALVNPQVRWRLCLSAALITLNWMAYVGGVASGRVVETSLGYFINPLVNVLLGVIVLSERLNRTQWTAVAFAAAGVSYLTWTAGHLPWISLALAFSFGLYGLVRKVVEVDSLAGLATETLILLPVGIAYLVWCELAGTGVASHTSMSTHILLILGGPVTAIPLVLFAYAVRRIPYSTLGLMQYMGPTLQLLLALYVYHEPFDGPRAAGFAFIWAALVIYAADGVWRTRTGQRRGAV